MPRRLKSVTGVPRRRAQALARLAERVRQSRVVVRRTRQHIRDRIVFYSLLLAGLMVFAFAGWPFARAHLQAVAILDLVSGKPVPRAIGAFVSDPVKTEDLTLHVELGAVRARLYLPKNKPDAPALVVLHGVHHLGIDEPRLEAFAAAMASCGIRVLTPELPDIMDCDADRWASRRDGAQLLGRAGIDCGGRSALSSGFQVRVRGGVAGLHGARGAVLPDRCG